MTDEQMRLLRRLRARVGRTEATPRVLYLEDTWVPTLIGLTIAGTLTYDATNTKAEWTRIGNRVLFNGRIRFTAIPVAPTGDVAITGLPYTSATTGFNSAGGCAMLLWTLNVGAGYTQVEGRVIDGETRIRLRESGDNLANIPTQGGEVVLVGGAAEFQFEGQYRVAT